jgi:hypothetical protein
MDYTVHLQKLVSDDNQAQKNLQSIDADYSTSFVQKSKGRLYPVGLLQLVKSSWMVVAKVTAVPADSQFLTKMLCKCVRDKSGQMEILCSNAAPYSTRNIEESREL